MTGKKTLTAIIEREEEMYVALCPELESRFHGEQYVTSRGSKNRCVGDAAAIDI
jgi:hypothetical protein